MWYYNGTPVEQLPPDCVGFVYMIENLDTGRKYIGKKLARFSKTTYKMVKLKNGTKKRKRIKTLVDSDWPTYYGSNKELNEHVEMQGTDRFRRHILHYCYSKAECSYVELREQIERRVLESDEYYNGIIQFKRHRNHLKKNFGPKTTP
jgi:hypothetical protein